MSDTQIHMCCFCLEEKKCLKCNDCWENCRQRIYYCSTDCQSNDWERHKEKEHNQAPSHLVHDKKLPRGELSKLSSKVYTGPTKNDVPFGFTGTLITTIFIPKGVTLSGLATGKNINSFTGLFGFGFTPAKGTVKFIEGHGAGDVFTGTFDQSGNIQKGKMTLKNGNVFQGEYNRHEVDTAEGTLKCVTGETYTGIWQNGKRVEGISTMPGKYTYVGKFINDLPSGQGKLTLNNGKVFEGNHNNEWWRKKMAKADAVEAGVGSAAGGGEEAGAAGGGEEEGAAGGSYDDDGNLIVNSYANVVDILHVLHAKVNLLEGRAVDMHRELLWMH